METKIIEILKERRELNITELPEIMPEIKGDYSMYMPVKEGFNPNILWLSGVTQDFIKAFNSLLIEKKIIKWEPRDLLLFIYDGSPIYTNIPMAENKLSKKDKECWLPICIKLAER